MRAAEEMLVNSASNEPATAQSRNQAKTDFYEMEQIKCKVVK